MVGNYLDRLFKKRVGLVEKINQVDWAIANQISYDVYEIMRIRRRSMDETELCYEMILLDSRVRLDEHISGALRILLKMGLVKEDDSPTHGDKRYLVVAINPKIERGD